MCVSYCVPETNMLGCKTHGVRKAQSMSPPSDTDAIYQYSIICIVSLLNNIVGIFYPYPITRETDLERRTRSLEEILRKIWLAI